MGHSLRPATRDPWPYPQGGCLKCGSTHGFLVHASNQIEYRAANRDSRLTRHTGSLIDIRDFTPLFIRVEDGPSTSAPRKVLGLEIRKARLRGAAGEPIWGTPQPLDSVPELKEWLHELRKPDGNQYAYPALCFALAGANDSRLETYSRSGRSSKLKDRPPDSSLNPRNPHLAPGFTSDRQRTPLPPPCGKELQIGRAHV